MREPQIDAFTGPGEPPDLCKPSIPAPNSKARDVEAAFRMTKICTSRYRSHRSISHHLVPVAVPTTCLAGMPSTSSAPFLQQDPQKHLCGVFLHLAGLPRSLGWRGIVGI